MNFLDFILLIFLGYAAYKGFRHGFIIEFFTLLAIVVGFYVGINFSDVTATWMKKSFGWDSEYLPVVAFTITFLGVGAMIYFGGKVLEKVVKIAQLSLVNKLAGLFFGSVKMLYILSVGLVILESYDEKSSFFPEKAKTESLLYNPVKNLSLKTIPSLKESMIFRANHFREEADSTGLTVDQVLRAKAIADSLGLDANDAKAIVKIHQQYGK